MLNEDDTAMTVNTNQNILQMMLVMLLLLR